MIDLNLLRPLQALLEEAHVSNAAVRCEISQPAMSRILERLRSAFDDELLIRSGRRYERSPRAEHLLVEVRDLLERLDAMVAGAAFRPQTYEATFRIATTDYENAVVIPHLLRDLETLAPHATLEVTPFSLGSLDDITAGRSDGAIIPNLDVPALLRSEPLFDDDYVCMISADHPLRGPRIRLSSYLAYRHTVVDVVRGLQPAADRSLAAAGLRRTVGYRTPYLGSAIFAVAATSMILTLPRRLAVRYADSAAVRTLEAPVELAGFSYAFVFHPRLQASDALRWFGERVRLAASTLETPSHRRTRVKSSSARR